MTYGKHLRTTREALRKTDRSFSLRQVAMRVGIEPAYLSKIERGEVAPPSEATTRKLAAELGDAAVRRARIEKHLVLAAIGGARHA